MKPIEIEVRAGENIEKACERLANETAPAFMIFNGTRVESKEGDTAQSLFDQWHAKREATRVASKVDGEEPLSISNQHLGRVTPDTEAICEAIYALARETREMRKAIVSVRNSIDKLDLPTYDGALQVEVTNSGR